MASSRLVYGHDPHHFNLTERHPVKPQSIYARNKLTTELNLQTTLPPERLTILRLANVFGHEINRDLFFGRMLTRLKENNKIIFNMSPECLRDFYPVWTLADALNVITAAPQGGIYNLGSGFGTACGDIADWVMEGYGSGRLDVLDHAMNDQYWLDITKAKATWKNLPVVTPEGLKEACMDCGQWLRTQ
jgi:dTDP-4-dehydrorhamnose reductase/UDP-glucose 4-epimerase